MQRNTRQRQAICRVFEENLNPLSVTEILNLGRRYLRSLSPATVYRAVREMVQEGELAVVELPGCPPHYELAGKHHHHHFVCRQCGRVLELEGCLRGWDRLAPRGCRVEEHELILYGSCPDCAR